MNQITRLKFTAALITVSMAAVCPVNAQEKRMALQSIPAGMELNQSGNKITQTNCTDKINYVTTNPTNVVQVGGAQNAITHIDGVYQVYPAYKGAVTGLEFDAFKNNSTVNNPVLYAQVFDVNSAGVPQWSTPLGTAVPVTINSTNLTSYLATFPTPVNITGNYGFAVGVINYVSTDSAAIFCKIIPAATQYAYLTVVTNNNTYPFNQFFTGNGNFMLRPIVTTSVNPNWTGQKTSTGCGLPVNYTFNNTSSAAPSYANNAVINPSGSTRVADFGDGSPTSNFAGSVMHSYTAAGNYIAQYTQTYIGWTNNCVETKSLSIAVAASAPSFTYVANGLSVTFSNTSTPDFTSFIWNFGDLSTSILQTPPVHTFPSPGTYVVELEGTAPCGTVKYTMSIVVTEFNVGIRETANGGKAVSLFPNPASNSLRISHDSKNAIDSKIDILNYTGATVKSLNADFTAGSTSIDISELSKGVYFIKLKGQEGDIVKSFIKE